MIVVADTSPINYLLLIDQIDLLLGRRIADHRGIPIVGTIGILDDAARQGLVELSEVIARLQQTNFRISRRIIQTLVENKSE